MKHTQWICRAILAATSPRVMKLQQQDLPISQETPVPLFAAIIHLIAASLEQLSLITLRLGHPQVQIILESKVLLYLLRYCQTFSLSSNSVERQYRLLYSIELPSLLTCMAPYLVYHSVLLPAVRLHKAMQREVQGIGLAHHPEIRQAWKLYSERLVYLDRVRQSQKSRPPLCEFPGASISVHYLVQKFTPVRSARIQKRDYIGWLVQDVVCITTARDHVKGQIGKRIVRNVPSDAKTNKVSTLPFDMVASR